MVSCDEFLAELGDYLEGESTAALRRELETHLAHCSTCQVIVDSTRKTVKIVSASGELDLSEQLPDPIVTRIMERIRAKPAGDLGADSDI